MSGVGKVRVNRVLDTLSQLLRRPTAPGDRSRPTPHLRVNVVPTSRDLELSQQPSPAHVVNIDVPLRQRNTHRVTAPEARKVSKEPLLGIHRSLPRATDTELPRQRVTQPPRLARRVERRPILTKLNR